MDKKLAEEEALKKAKDEKHAAGKSSGMSGRDLVRHFLCWSRLLPFPSRVPPYFRPCVPIG